MEKRNTLIAITEITTPAITLIAIVGLLVNANTKTSAELKHQDSSVKVEVRKSQPENTKQDSCFRERKENRLVCDQ